MYIKCSKLLLFALSILTALLVVILTVFSEDIVLKTRILLASFANSQAYHFVSPNGSDSNPGTLDLPFKTVQKCADLVKPSETCYLRAGTYRETIHPALSGMASEPIVFAAYQNEDVTISGADPVKDWSQFKGSTYQAKVSLPISGYSDTGFLANQVFVNGEMMPEARWPNTGRDLMRPTLASGGVKSQGGTAATVENKEIPDLPEGWAGATVWTSEWYVTRTGTITGGSKGKLTAKMTAPYDRGGFWIYLVGKLGLLDSEGEWFYDGNKQTLYLWSPGGKQPSSVEVKQRNFAFDLTDRSYIELRNLKLFASTITTSDASEGVVIDGIRAKYVSHHMTLPPLPKAEQAPGSDDGLIVSSHAHDTGIQLRGTSHILKNSTIQWSSGNGILLEGKGHTVTNNIIANTDYMVSYAAPVRINGSGHRINNNTIVGAGRDAIDIDWHTAGLDARNIEIAYNDISNFGMLSTDLGAIYACCYVNLEYGSIHHNWIHDANAFSPFWGTRGVYLDLETYNSTIHHNAIWKISGGKDSFYLAVGAKKRGYHRVFNNTFLGPVVTDESVEARNNILAASKSIDAGKQSNNLFMQTDPKFHNPNASDFTLSSDSPAVNAGITIPGIAEDFVGNAPDIGAYERGSEIGKVGSNLTIPSD
jgi:Right handed beta helix region